MNKLVALFLGLTLNFTSQAKSVQVGWELWFPYQYRNAQQELIGLDFEIFNAVFKKAGYTTEFTELPWKRHLHYLKTGEMDVAMGASKSEERERYAKFSQAYRQETVKLYIRNGKAKDIKLSKLSELASSKYMFGIESGYYYGDEYQELMKMPEFREHIIEVVDIEENVTLLLEGHIDGFLVSPETIKAFSKKYKMKGEFEQHPISIYRADIHIMFSKLSTDPIMIKAIDDAISELKQSGELTKILNKWTVLN